ncbi:transglutaminase domain-containing protein [Paenalkalicoccus suaedae]|uniref:Transglutaminase domain-containing protein n=1 Tax=Paenalkalicoccus suaedae TaxID=2592382 RepID=A0A859FJP6_9BACI|nr:transglutaminase-like domain-containing protein [Paenalkalicoccus suaedae]QKS73006.1 transglutaminase domain-containing protein [Paenalkalicoccus suaedae]
MDSSRITYTYENRSDAPMELWLSAAPGTTDIQFTHVEPSHEEAHPFLGELFYFRLDAKESLRYEANYSSPRASALTEEARQYFLRNSALVPVDEGTKQKAEQITIDASTVKEKVFAIFSHVKESFRYSSQIKGRGTGITLNTGKGDCGELSAMIASYCRSLGIPARVMVGAFKGSFQPHAWNEVYIEEEGWMPLDVSVSMYTFFRHPLRNIGSIVRWGAFRNRARYFGEIESGRVVFSIDPERELTPAYIDREDPTASMTFPVGGEEFPWGQESLDGKAPYMQPIYPRLNGELTKIKQRDVLGSFRVKSNQLIDYVTSQTKIFAFTIAAALIYLSIGLNLFNIALPSMFETVLSGATVVALGIFSLLTLIRREFNVPLLILCVLFAFSMLSFIMGLITSA